MQFFTPDLYVRFNSPDDKIADEANDQWEEAIAKYRKHLDRLSAKLPGPVHRLAELCLHDAEIVAMEEDGGVVQSTDGVETISPTPGVQIGILSARQESKAFSILYVLAGDIHEQAVPQDWPFSAGSKHLLYDEIDIDGDDPSQFVHRLLLSDGRVLEIVFGNVFTYCFDLHVKSAAG